MMDVSCTLPPKKEMISLLFPAVSFGRIHLARSSLDIQGRLISKVNKSCGLLFFFFHLFQLLNQGHAASVTQVDSQSSQQMSWNRLL